MTIPFSSSIRAILLLALGTALLLPLSLRAAETDTDLGRANRAYQEGRYEDSIKLFQQLIATRGYSAPLCFDLGNAEAKAGHLGPALLNYERARYLAPGDAGIDHNLQVTRRQAGLPPNSYRWWQIVMRSIDWTLWLGIILACLFLLFAALIGAANAEALSSRIRISTAVLRKFFKGIAFVCIPLFLFFGFVELDTIGFNQRIEGVIVAKSATLRLSPFDSAEKTGSLPEGELVTVEAPHADYFWVDDGSKQSGWVQGSEIEPVVPGSFAVSKGE
jgi:hypothetical protein